MATTAVFDPLLPAESATAESQLSRRVATMCNSRLLAGLAESECRMLALSASKRTYAADELVFSQGTPIRNVMLVETGTVKLTQVGEDSEVVLWVCGPCDAIGLSSETPLSRHSCTARAVRECSVLKWEYRFLQRVIQEYPTIKKNMDNILGGRLRELEQRFCELSTGSTSHRLGRALVRLAGSVGQPEDQGIRVHLSREELAGIIGTSMFTISRIITKWANQGLILPLREAVIVCSTERLAAMCRASQEDGSAPEYEFSEACI